MDWNADRGLTVRIAVALTLVFVLPIVFMYTFVFVINAVGLDLFAWAIGRPLNGRVYVEPWLVVGGVATGFVLQFFVGESVALHSIDAHHVDRAERPDLYARLERLSRTAEIPVPRVAVSDADVPNAFTIGVRPSKATIVVTEGLLDILDEDELDAVLAHELAHVKNRDGAVMSLSYFLPALTYVVAIAAFSVLRSFFHVLGSARHVDDDGLKGVAVATVVLAVSAVVTVAISVLFWLASFALFRILSQYREYAADRGAAAITGDPASLASGLRAIDDEMSELPDTDLRHADGGLEALYVAPIDDYQFDEDRELLTSDIFPATHPSTEDRIDRLSKLAGEQR